MLDFKSFRNQLYKVNNDQFEDLVFQAFYFQSRNNLIYKKFLKSLRINPGEVKQIEQIPFLPIRFFKDHKIISGDWKADHIFESSGTTGAVTSKHYVDDLAFYKKHSLINFTTFYGAVNDYHFLGLLPTYLERENSSLVHMVQHFIEVSKSNHSGFYLYNYDDLRMKLDEISHKIGDKRKIMVIGISFALLEAAIQKVLPLSNELMVVETGGMKGKRREMIRDELHSILRDQWNVDFIHSEYGMTEMLSQCYSKGDGNFETPPWVKVMTRDLNDPFSYTTSAGGINIIDLANIHSCAFIETQDIGRIHPTGKFEVLGRFDNSDIRGCNLLLS